MVEALIIIIGLGLCFLGLAVCGIMLLVDDIREYKWRKQMKKGGVKND